MELLHCFLDLTLPAASILGLLFTWPLIAFGKLAYYFLHLFKKEELAGKVVLITGASSGIGENLAYQYAKRGAKLVLSARRESKLHAVAERARSMGASDTFVITADVTKEEDCKRIIDETIRHYGQLNHLVLNAGVAHSFLFEEAKDTKGFGIVIDSLFWGSVYPTFYALPHLRQSKGRIVVVASVASWLTYPRQSLYNAGKAAVLNFFDTLRVEVRDTVGITIAQPGWVESEMTQGKFVSDHGETTFKQDRRDIHVGPFPVLPVMECAKAIVSGAERKMRYVVVPFWYLSFLPYRIVTPEVMDWFYFIMFVPRGGNPPLSKKIVDKTHITKKLFPPSLQQKKE